MSHSSYLRPQEGRPCLHAPTSPGKTVENEQHAAHCRRLDHEVTTATAHAHTGQLLRLSPGMAPTLVQLTRVELVQPTYVLCILWSVESIHISLLLLQDGVTALMIAVYHGQSYIVDIIIRFKCDINLETKVGVVTYVKCI